MKSKSALVLACLFSSSLFAQSLPDEINYAPYQARYQSLSADVETAVKTLNQDQSDLEASKKYVTEMTAHIGDLQDEIQNLRYRIDGLQRSIPDLQSQNTQLQIDRSNIESTLRYRQNDDARASAQLQNAQRELAMLQDILDRKNARLNGLKNEFNQAQGFQRAIEAKISQVSAQLQTINQQLSNELSQKASMEQALRNGEARISSLQASLSQAQSAQAEAQRVVQSVNDKLQAANQEVTQAQKELSDKIAARAPAPEIQAAQQKFMTARTNQQQLIQNLQVAQRIVNQQNAQVSQANVQLENAKRDQVALPGRIAQSQAAIQTLTQRRDELAPTLPRMNADLETARRNTEMRARAVMDGQRDMEQDLQRFNYKSQQVSAIVNELNQIRSDMTSLLARRDQINTQINQNNQQIVTNQRAIPTLQQNIISNQNEIRSGQAEIAKAQDDISTLTQAVSQDQANLTRLTSARDAAEIAFTTRRDLYGRYQSEAEDLGSSQSEVAVSLGQKEGARIASVLSQQNGSLIGADLGKSEARYWGLVRGENQGFAQGYSRGLQSQEDINQAILDAGKKAAADAELFAQTNNRPVFFEELVQAEFKKPLSTIPAMTSMLKLGAIDATTDSLSSLEGVMDAVLPLGQEEISRSTQTRTPLDSQIDLARQSVKDLSAKVEILRVADNAYQSPSNIPHQASNCSQVYKGLAIFKASCESAYKASFTRKFLASAEQVFDQNYPNAFEDVFESVNVTQREKAFPSELQAALKVADAEGLRVGKVEIYKSTYDSTYKTAYVSEIDRARAKAKSDAANELSFFLKSRPLLALSESVLSGDSFRGGEEVSVQTKVKNVGFVRFDGPVIIRITEVVNGAVTAGNATLNGAAERSITTLPALKVRISDSAKSGDRVIVRGIVDLPGDVYKGSRRETFELAQVLAANPANNLTMNYDQTPAIKGLFKRYIQIMNVQVSPTVDDVQEGYSVKLTPDSASAPYINISQGEASTGALRMGSMSELKFSYGFPDSAKNRTLNLTLSVSYRGKVIRSEAIVLRPH